MDYPWKTTALFLTPKTVASHFWRRPKLEDHVSGHGPGYLNRDRIRKAEGFCGNETSATYGDGLSDIN